MYLSGLAETIFSEEEGAVSNIKLTMGNVTSPFYFAGLAHYSYSKNRTNKLVMDNIELETGDIVLGNSNKYKGDFDGLVRELGMTVSNVIAKFGNVYTMDRFRGAALGSIVQENAKYKNVKVEIESMISEAGIVCAVNELYGIVENTGVIIRHMQTDDNNANAFDIVYDGAKIKNMVYYADVYAKNHQYSGFAYDIKSPQVELENIFSAIRLNKFTKLDETTHKASDAEVYHENPLLFNVVPTSAEVEVPGSDPDNMLYSLELTKARNVYWLKRDTADFAAKKKYMEDTTHEQFFGIVPEITDVIVQGTTLDINRTFSGCETIDDDCATPWAPVDDMVFITEPRGGEIGLPWLK